MKKSKFTPTIVSKQFTRLFTLAVIGIGLIVLIGWFSGFMFLTRFSMNEVPMAPSTAYLFITLAVGLWCYLRPQKIAINRNADDYPLWRTNCVTDNRSSFKIYKVDGGARRSGSIASRFKYYND